MDSVCSASRLRRLRISRTRFTRAKAAAERLDSVAHGEERVITHVDPVNGHKSVTFLRRDHFVTDFKALIRYVRGFLTKHGYHITAGRYLHEKR